MDKELVYFIKNSAEKITETYFNVEVQNVTVRETTDLYMPKKDVVIALNLKGKIEGLVLIGLTSEDASFLGKTVLELKGFMDGGFWDELAQSAVLEYGNEVMGYVTELLSDEGYICDISTPKFADKELYRNIKKDIKMFELEVNREFREAKIEFRVYRA